MQETLRLSWFYFFIHFGSQNLLKIDFDIYKVGVVVCLAFKI